MEIEQPYLGINIRGSKLMNILAGMPSNASKVFWDIAASLRTNDDEMPMVVIDDAFVDKLSSDLGVSRKVAWGGIDWLVDNDVISLVRKDGQLLRNTYTFDSDMFRYVESNALDDEEHSIHEVYEVADKEEGHCRFLKYTNALATFYELTHVARYVLIELVTNMEYVEGRNVTVVDTSLERKIKRRCEIGIAKYREALAAIARARLFTEDDGSVLVWNKNVFGTSDWNSIESVRAQFNYDTLVMSVIASVTDSD